MVAVTSALRRGAGSRQAAPLLVLAVAGWLLACAASQPDARPKGSAAEPAPIDVSAVARRQLVLQADMEDLEARISRLRSQGGWRSRGYFDAAEHDAIEDLLFRFLTLHRACWGEVDRLGGIGLAQTPPAQHPAAHLLVLHAGLLLADSGAFLVSAFADDPVAIAKLDEAFYRAEIPEGSYDRLRRSVSSKKRRRVLDEAWALHQADQADPHGAAASALRAEPALGPVLAALPALRAREAARVGQLDATGDGLVTEIGDSDAGRAAGASGRALETVGYRTRSLVFKDVSRLKSPTAHLIRFSESQKRELRGLLRPADLLLTYTAGYASDVFIPGTFKHGITYVGGAEERAEAGLTATSVPPVARPGAASFAENLARTRMPDGSRADLIEAVAEGVKLSNLDRILDTHVNRLLVLRPEIDAEERTAFLAGVFAFLGDPYDFRFDFADASRQVCTEVIYRALDGKGGIDFTLTPRAGHPTLSADDVVAYHFAAPGRFEVVAYAEEDPEGRDHAAGLWKGAAAEQRLRQRTADRGRGGS